MIDGWAKLGNPGWTWESLFPYYKKSYTLHPLGIQKFEHLGLDWIKRDVHGTAGPIQVAFPTERNSLAKAWTEVFQSIGYNTTADPFSGKSIGAYSALAAVDPTTTTRSYAATGYGLAAMKRSGVHIITEAVAQRILLDASPSVFRMRASGVEVVVGGNLFVVNANKEVILSAGAFNTPKLLELSGIGNKEMLHDFGIPVKISNPNVGENLQDHLTTGISFEVADTIFTGDPLLRREPESVQAAIKMYTDGRTGPMAIGGAQSSAFMPMLDFSGKKTQAELFDRFLSSTEGDRKIVREILDRADATTCSMFMFLAQVNLHEASGGFIKEQLLPENYLTLGVMQSLPVSRGNAHIPSSIVNDQQIIDPQYFSHPLDIEIMARNLLDIVKLHKNDILAPYLKPDGKRNHPDAFLTDLDSAKKYLRDTATTAHHSCGTASMLPEDKGGVVNEKLMVYGTTNLRVCDASIIPLIPRGNIMSTVYAVAEKAADIIKADAKG